MSADGNTKVQVEDPVQSATAVLETELDHATEAGTSGDADDSDDSDIECPQLVDTTAATMILAAAATSASDVPRSKSPPPIIRLTEADEEEIDESAWQLLEAALASCTTAALARAEVLKAGSGASAGAGASATTAAWFPWAALALCRDELKLLRQSTVVVETILLAKKES